ncbi:hypothetical protein EYF80_058797 [Liparis tanakae]|uniref:Uncharacterized protein n=1 Tax=Liparis tanakae TaxID=230148 RepID=A0A4Z2ER46_9TELE|nr:hypothetical protein EYF80_058797 [Liparis tanakae]
MTPAAGHVEEEAAEQEVHSQALLGQRGGHLVGQRGELRGVGHVEAAGGGHGAEGVGGVLQGHDLSAVVRTSLGGLTEAQLVALNLGKRGGGGRHADRVMNAW